MSLRVVLVVVAGAFIGSLLAHPERPSLVDPGKARELFHLAQVNRTNQDGQLTIVEVQEIFADFDMDGDNLVERPEFIIEWTSKGLGDEVAAGFLFSRADTDQDGSITASPDLVRVFHYFDLNGDGKVSEVEFVVVWSALSH